MFLTTVLLGGETIFPCFGESEVVPPPLKSEIIAPVDKSNCEPLNLRSAPLPPPSAHNSVLHLFTKPPPALFRPFTRLQRTLYRSKPFITRVVRLLSSLSSSHTHQPSCTTHFHCLPSTLDSHINTSSDFKQIPSRRQDAIDPTDLPPPAQIRT